MSPGQGHDRASDDVPCQEDKEVLIELEEKRRQLDQEIAQFKAQKDEQFKDFETQLRQRRRSSTSRTSPSSRGNTEMKANGFNNHNTPSIFAAQESYSGFPLDRPDETIARVRGRLSAEQMDAQNLPSPSPSPSGSSSTEGKSISSSTTGTITPPAYERERDFHGLFTPAYLPLLDSKHASLPKLSSSETSLHSQHSSRISPDELRMKPSSPSAKRNSLNLHIQNQISPTIKASTSLPSALRRTSSEGRPKSPKHVTFRLSNYTVVDPSSSYEELPSPDISESERNIANEMTAGDSNNAVTKSSAQQHSIPKSPPYVEETPQGDLPDGNDDDFAFAFDEELEGVNNDQKPSRGTGFDDEAPDLDDVGNTSAAKAMKYGSPMAGSLPISIVRPSPRGHEGGMYSVR